jgi:hypothetical protein
MREWRRSITQHRNSGSNNAKVVTRRCIVSANVAINAYGQTSRRDVRRQMKLGIV